MEKIVTLEKVQDAIKALRGRGEKVSRRNVRAITGGGMGTVHQLMVEAENIESLQSTSPRDRISQTLQNAILSEIGGQIEEATLKLQEQLDRMRSREDEVYQSLDESERKVKALDSELIRVKEESDIKLKEVDKDLALATEKNNLLENSVAGLQEENKKLVATAEAAKIETAKAQTQTEHANQAATKAETRAGQLAGEVEVLRSELTDTEKKLAVTEQRADDLAEALAKLEKLIRPKK